jgi:nucleotide-binding universal stress UspA family protein
MRVLAVLQSLVPVPTTVPALESHTFASEEAYRVIEEADERERIRLHETVELAAELLQKAGLSVTPVVIEGDARHEINAEAARWHADSVFVGARGLGAIDRLLLGSVSREVLAHAPCAVEIVRHISG